MTLIHFWDANGPPGIGSQDDEDEEMIARNNELPEIELKIETSTQISDKDIIDKVIKMDEVGEVKLFTVSYSSQDNVQRIFIQIKTDFKDSGFLTSEAMKKMLRKTGLKPLYCDFRDGRSEDSKFHIEQ